MIENSTLGLTMLDGAHKVVVTGEEHHQDVLWGYTPHAGRGRQVAVELTQAGPQRRLEARLDGRRVGELTAMMSQRYGPVVEQVQRQGGRAGCLGMVVVGKRGIEVELRLPTVGPGRSAPVVIPPTLAQPTPPLPRLPRPGPPDLGTPPVRRRGRKPLWVGVGVVGLLVVVAAWGSSRDTATTPATPAATSVSTTAAASVTTAPITTAPVTTAQAAPADPPATSPRKSSAAAARPAPAVDVPAPRVADPEPAADPAPSSAYYKNCTAAKAAGAAPLHRGDPGYRAALDRDGDGVACET